MQACLREKGREKGCVYVCAKKEERNRDQKREDEKDLNKKKCPEKMKRNISKSRSTNKYKKEN